MSGVGIMLSKEIISTGIQFRSVYANIVQCYVPTDPDDEETKEAFYSQLSRLMYSLNKAEITLVKEVFNAQLGQVNTGIERTMGQHGMHNRSGNGERLIEMCTENNLVIEGTIFPHRDTNTHGLHREERRASWDYICISDKWR